MLQCRSLSEFTVLMFEDDFSQRMYVFFLSVHWSCSYLYCLKMVVCDADNDTVLIPRTVKIKSFPSDVTRQLEKELHSFAGLSSLKMYSPEVLVGIDTAFQYVPSMDLDDGEASEVSRCLSFFKLPLAVCLPWHTHSRSIVDKHLDTKKVCCLIRLQNGLIMRCKNTLNFRTCDTFLNAFMDRNSIAILLQGGRLVFLGSQNAGGDQKTMIK